MSRREYDDRQSDYYRRSRNGRDYRERDVDVSRSRYDGPTRRNETVVKERESDTVITQGHRTERGDRRLDFLEEDYGRNPNTGPLVVREERKVVEDDDVRSRGGRTVRKEKLEVDDEVYTRGHSRGGRSRGPPPAREQKEEIIFRERESSRPRRAPYPHSDQDFEEKEEVIFRERTRSRSRPPPSRAPVTEEKIDIRIRDHESERPVSRPPPLRSEFSERDVEEIRFSRGKGDREPPAKGSVVEKETITIREKETESRPRPPRSEVVDKEEIVIKEKRSSPSRDRRGRDVTKEEIDIKIREQSAPPPRARSQSRGRLVAKKEEEWIVRRKRTPSPSPPPPPRDYEKEEIIIRRKIRTPSPEPVREPTPEPPPPPPLEPIYRPPIIQEVITHHRHIDHGIERARSPTPPPPPSPPSPPQEDNLEIEIKRTGTRNGKRYEEDLIIEQDISERKGREVEHSETKEVTHRSVSTSSRGVSTRRRYEEDDVVAEADYYNRKVSSRAHPGEAYNGATKDWGVVDVPPGTERVRMDGAGGGRQDIYWDRYAGERRGKFVTGDRIYEEDFEHSLPSPSRHRDDEVVRETKITEKRVVEETSRGKTRDRMWTEITKDLVTKEAIEERGYEYEETDDYFYVMEYLRYENVLKLVELTEEIRRERRKRIREIQWEREREEAERVPKMLPPPPPVPAPPRSRYDERIYEREYRYDRDGRYRR